MNSFERDNKIYSGSSRVFIISFLFFSITYHAFSCFMKEWPLKFTHIRSCYLKQNTLLNKLHTKSHETLNGSFQTKLFYTYATIKQLFWHFHIENLDICYYVDACIKFTYYKFIKFKKNKVYCFTNAVFCKGENKTKMKYQ